MKIIGSYRRKALLNDHPPILNRVLIGSNGKEYDLIAGTVLALDGDKNIEYSSSKKVSCVLAEDVTVPPSGDTYALAYVHASVVTSELIWAEGVTAEQQKTALAELRSLGIYTSEA